MSVAATAANTRDRRLLCEHVASDARETCETCGFVPLAIPDFVGQVASVGWRVWAVVRDEDGRLRLASPCTIADPRGREFEEPTLVWPPGEEYVARCELRRLIRKAPVGDGLASPDWLRVSPQMIFGQRGLAFDFDFSLLRTRAVSTGLEDHAAPAPGCNCGVKAAPNRAELGPWLALSYEGLRDHFGTRGYATVLDRVLGFTALVGDVLADEEYPAGKYVRAAAGYPLTLYVVEGIERRVEIEETAEQLADYGVPVETVPLEEVIPAELIEAVRRRPPASASRRARPPREPGDELVFSGPPQHTTEPLHGIPFVEAPEPEWAAVPDAVAEEPLPDGVATGVVLVEPDGRVWIVEPAGHFGGVEHTWPKGQREPGLTPQQNALREVYEETGSSPSWRPWSAIGSSYRGCGRSPATTWAAGWAERRGHSSGMRRRP